MDPKEIKISFKCGYEVEELNADDVIVAYKEGEVFNLFTVNIVDPFKG